MRRVLNIILIYCSFLKSAHSGYNENEEMFYRMIREGDPLSFNPQEGREASGTSKDCLESLPYKDHLVGINNGPLHTSTPLLFDDSKGTLFSLLEEFQEMSHIGNLDKKQLTPQNETYAGDNPHDGIMKSNQEVAKLLEVAKEILEEIGELKENWYEERFNASKSLSDRYKRSSIIEIDYTSLDRQILDLFFNITYYEGRDRPFLYFSESKYRKFLSVTSTGVFSKLNVPEDSNFEFLNVKEFISLHKYYRMIPELLILERIRASTSLHQDLIFYYLRSLNVLLDYCSENNSLHLGWNVRIIHFIEKIIVSVTSLTKCDIMKVRDMAICINDCGRVHSNSLLCVFIYNFDYVFRFKHKVKTIYKTTQHRWLQHIRVVSLYLVYNHLLLNTHLSKQAYERERIENFVFLVDTSNPCVNCVMEECVSILCPIGTTF